MGPPLGGQSCRPSIRPVVIALTWSMIISPPHRRNNLTGSFPRGPPSSQAAGCAAALQAQLQALRTGLAEVSRLAMGDNPTVSTKESPLWRRGKHADKRFLDNISIIHTVFEQAVIEFWIKVSSMHSGWIILMSFFLAANSQFKYWPEIFFPVTTYSIFIFLPLLNQRDFNLRSAFL